MLKNTSFKKLLLNPGLSFNVDEDGNDPCSGDYSQIVEALPGLEGVSGSSISGVSKLRARNAQPLADTDDRYLGKTVKRAELDDPDEKLHEDYDPSLAKYFLVEETDDEDENYEISNGVDSNDLTDDFERFADDDSEEDEEEVEEDVDEEESADDEDQHGNYTDDDGGGNSDTGFDDASDGLANSEESSCQEEEEDDDEEGSEGAIKVTGLEDLSEEQQKAKSVVKQLVLYDTLFQARIAMQKVMRGSIQLPVSTARQAFLQQEGETGDRFKGCLEAATTAAVGLVQELLALQEALLESNPESKGVLRGDSSSSVQEASKQKATAESDEEITSSEDESDEEGKAWSRKKQDSSSSGFDDNTPKKTAKRKRDSVCDVKELEETLAKRHRDMRPYRNKVVAFWDERTKLLQTQSKGRDGKGGGAFAAFDDGFGVMVRRILADRDKLLKRTQLRSIHRENFTAPIGSKEVVAKQKVDVDLDIPAASNQSPFERYDPEIYDDTDFYCRYMEEIIKDKHRRGNSNLTTAEFLDVQQKLRKKNKRVVDTRRSKGRKLKYDVVSSLLQYLPPCGTTIMEDEAVEQVTMSLFGGTLTTTPASAETLRS